MGSRTPVVFLDNVQLTDFTFLLNMNLNDVDEIYINKRGYGMGNDGSNGSIRIYSKKIIANKTKPTQIKSKSLEIKNGFLIFLAIGIYFLLMELLGLSQLFYLRLVNIFFVFY